MTDSSQSTISSAVFETGGERLPVRPVHIMSDIHGEAAAFTHLVRTRSGEVRATLERVLAGAGSSEAIEKLLQIVCYPEEVCDRAHAKQLDTRTWWHDKLGSLCMLVSVLDREFPQAGVTGASATEERPDVVNGATACPVPGVTSEPADVAALRTLVGWGSSSASVEAFNAAVDALAQVGLARTAVCTIAYWIRRTCAGTSFCVGDIWDRGAHGDDVMDQLMQIPEISVQWGNHDVCWMGAAAGDATCIATCLRNNIKYGNTAQFEQGYGISLDGLRAFAQATYAERTSDEPEAMTPLYKAISVLLFKSEGQAIRRHPEWHMEGRLLLDKIDLAAGTVRVGEADYPVNTRDFPTVDFSKDGDAYAYTEAEAAVMGELAQAFTASERLQRQVQWLYDNGEVYRYVPAGIAQGVPSGVRASDGMRNTGGQGTVAQGGCLLIHGCVPMEEDGTLAQVDCGDRTRAGRELLDWTEAMCRRAWEGRDQRDLDWMSFFWTGWQSTFMGRVVKTFERTYINDKSTWTEPEDPYYALTKDSAEPCATVLKEFGCDPERDVIVNGHTPVKLPKGQKPVRGQGRRLVIDGGFCHAYRKSTGIAGYTLIRDASGARLVTHTDFAGLDAFFEEHQDVQHTAQRL